MNSLLLCIATAIPLLVTASDDTDKIYWETPAYLSKLESVKTQVQYVYHRCREPFAGNWILPLNRMPEMEGYSDLHQRSISRYKGREFLLSLVIPTLNCLWNDVIFLSPIHPHKHYEEYTKIGYTDQETPRIYYFKIPIEVLKEKRVSVWKWLSNEKYPKELDSYCAFDFSLYQELEELPDDTKEFWKQYFNPENPTLYPPYNWYRIPHILCQDPIDVSDERVTLIDWADPID